ncbi:MAG: hypothetical protein IT193_11480 [Propionibacteriaceae bacterium]|nr:hypothetical protein [Propionibacteriaceae bacterium]
MTAGPQPEGIGTPSGGQPGFSPPSAGPVPPAAAPPASAPQQADASGQWAPPDPKSLVVTPPKGRPARPTRRPRGRVVAATLAGAMVLVGILSALPLMPAVQGPQQPAASPVATPAPIETVSPTVAPRPTTTATTGGDLGTAVAFRTGRGSGTVTVSSAVWTDSGEMAPEAGSRYLIVDVAVACTGGELPVDALLLLAVSGEAGELPGFGPALTSPLAGQLLEAGETATGQVGYSLPPGEVTLQLLDSELRPVAAIRIPAP